MSEFTDIAWADSTASPWGGCRRWSVGCVHCYIESTPPLRRVGYQMGDPRIRFAGFEDLARKLNRYSICRGCGARHIFHAPPDDTIECPSCETYSRWRRLRIFPSLLDWLDEEAPLEWLADFLWIVSQCQNLDWLLLTKRIENFGPLFDTLRRLTWPKAREWIDRWYNGEAPQHVWFGVTCENQAIADKRIPKLLKIPAAVRWLSVEPLLETIDLHYACFNGADSFGSMPGIDWVIVGGESGPKRRDCGIEAISDVTRQCQAARVPIFVKQDCALKPGQQGRLPEEIWALKEFPQKRIQNA